MLRNILGNFLADQVSQSLKPRGHEMGPYGDPEFLPSMWEYNPNFLAREFFNLEPDSFLVNPMAENLVFLPREVLYKICSMLSQAEFMRVSSTCRLLYWQMMTYCRCHVPLDQMSIRADVAELSPREMLIWEHKKYEMSPKYASHNWFFNPPRHLQRPFLVEQCDLFLYLKHFEAEIFHHCAELLESLRKHADKFAVYLILDESAPNIPATDKFLKMLSATYFEVRAPYLVDGRFLYKNAVDYTYLEESYIHQMDSVAVMNTSGRPPDGFLLNRFGIYKSPSLAVVSKTLNEFFYGETKLDYHCYLECDENQEEIFHWLQSFIPFLHGRNEPEGSEFWERIIDVASNGRQVVIQAYRLPGRRGCENCRLEIGRGPPGDVFNRFQRRAAQLLEGFKESFLPEGSEKNEEEEEEDEEDEEEEIDELPPKNEIGSGEEADVSSSEE